MRIFALFHQYKLLVFAAANKGSISLYMYVKNNDEIYRCDEFWEYKSNITVWGILWNSDTYQKSYDVSLGLFTRIPPVRWLMILASSKTIAVDLLAILAIANRNNS